MKKKLPKNDKNSSHNKRYKTDIGKRERRKEMYQKSKVTATIRFFTFLFCTWKRIYFAGKYR